MDEMEEEAPPMIGQARGKHIKKRALKNKALSVTFNEKALKDYVSGFHKRKKKRRKEARQKQQEAERRKRIELRKKRKAEKEFALYGGPLPKDAAESDDGSDHEQDEGSEDDDESDAVPSVSGTKLYDNGDFKVTVTTSEISREEEEDADHPAVRSVKTPPPGAAKKHDVPVKKKPMKKVVNRRSRPKLLSKRDRRKGKRGSSDKNRR